MEVEFNNGFVTALGLFYGHEAQYKENRHKKIINYDLRIYAAADHLFEIEIPETISKKLKKRIKRFVDEVYEIRLLNPSFETGDRLFKECRIILAEIDKEVFGLKVTVNFP